MAKKSGSGRIGGTPSGVAEGVRGLPSDETNDSFSKNWNSPMNVNNTKDSNPENNYPRGSKFSPSNPLGIKGLKE